MGREATSVPGVTAGSGESKTRRRIVKLLKTGGAMDSASLARRLNVTAMAVRQHLCALQQEKLVTAEGGRCPQPQPNTGA
jgi:predicted ArsR family transcriptional regulator